MKSDKRGRGFSKARRRYFIFLIIVLIILIIISLPLFSVRISNDENSLYNKIILRQNRADIKDDSSGAANRSDFEGQLSSNSGYRDVRVGLYENKPKIFTDNTGIPAGIFVDILNEIARKEKWNLIYVPSGWDECLEALENGYIDLMPDIAYSQERAKKFDFHEEEVVSSWSVVYSNSRKQINEIAELEGCTVAVLKDSIQETVLKNLAKGFTFNINFIEAKSFEEAFRLTSKGIADAAASNLFFGDYFYRQYGLKKTPIIFEPATLYYAATIGANRDLLEIIDKNLRMMKAESGSVYYKTLQKWMGNPPKVIVPHYIVWIIASLIGVLISAIVFIFLLRWQVKIKTLDLAYSNKMLQESETKFRDLFDKHAAVKLIIDPENGHIIEANEAAERFYGWTTGQLRNMRIQDINTLSPEQVKTEMEKTINQEHSQFEFRHRLADGSIRDVEVLSSKINIKGKLFLHSIIQDITRRKLAEKEKENLQAQFNQAQKMESIGRLAGGVAHDYNNMLSIILGYTEMALEKTDSSKPIYDDLKEVLNAARRSASITRQLLAFARKQIVSPVVLNFNETVEGMLKMLQRLIGENIRLEWLPGSGLWFVKMDSSQIDQILANLCVNARDAITDVGKITIETGNVEFDESYCALHSGFLPGKYVLLAVSDDGCGMDREIMDHVFEPFFTTKKMGEGTGLGLAMVYGIVRQNKGFINVYSEPWTGTTFRLYFPMNEDKDEKDIPETTPEIHEAKGEIILLVEDDPTILELGNKMLEKLGYRVLSADTPKDAIRLAGEYGSGINLLITDIVMPEMNGRDLADKLRSLCPGLKVLFMSGYTNNAIAYSGVILEENANFIQKPFSVKDFASQVRKSLDS